MEMSCSFNVHKMTLNYMYPGQLYVAGRCTCTAIFFPEAAISLVKAPRNQDLWETSEHAHEPTLVIINNTCYWMRLSMIS